MADPALRKALAAGEFISAPGIYDLVSALIADRMGFKALYATGYGTVASYLGVADAGIATYTDMVARVSRFAQIAKTPIIADADTGYGGLLNVHHTVRGYEAAGVTAIQLEDQEFPKKCGHTPFKRCVPAQDMVDKIRVAAEAREDKQNFLIIARTDARAELGVDEAMRRLEAYARAGADILFFEAPQSEDEMRRACEAFDLPMMANMSDGGKTPILPAKTLAEIGYALAIYPSMTSLIAAAAMERALKHLKAEGTSQAPGAELFDFNEFCQRIGFEEVWEFEKRWAR